jgi:hypothetical protein
MKSFADTVKSWASGDRSSAANLSNIATTCESIEDAIQHVRSRGFDPTYIVGPPNKQLSRFWCCEVLESDHVENVFVISEDALERHPAHPHRIIVPNPVGLAVVEIAQ